MRLSWARSGAGGTHLTRTAEAHRSAAARGPPPRTGASRPARAEGPGARRGGRGRDHRRRPPSGSPSHLRQRGVRARDGLSRRRGAGEELPLPPGSRHRPGRDRRDPRGRRRGARVRRRDPQLPAGRHPVLEPALHHARARRERRGHPLHRDPVGRQRAPRDRGGAATGQGGAGERPAAGGACPAVPSPAARDAPPGAPRRARVPSLHGPRGGRHGRLPSSRRLGRAVPAGRERARGGGRPPVVHPEPPALALPGRVAPRRGNRGRARHRSALAPRRAPQPHVPDGPDAAVLHPRLRGVRRGARPAPVRRRRPPVARPPAPGRAARADSRPGASDRHARARGLPGRERRPRAGRPSLLLHRRGPGGARRGRGGIRRRTPPGRARAGAGPAPGGGARARRRRRQGLVGRRPQGRRLAPRDREGPGGRVVGFFHRRSCSWRLRQGR